MKDRGKKFMKCSHPAYDLILYAFFYDLYYCGI